jgi:hypothetical protein
MENPCVGGSIHPRVTNDIPKNADARETAFWF